MFGTECDGIEFGICESLGKKVANVKDVDVVWYFLVGIMWIWRNTYRSQLSRLGTLVKRNSLGR